LGPPGLGRHLLAPSVVTMPWKLAGEQIFFLRILHWTTVRSFSLEGAEEYRVFSEFGFSWSAGSMNTLQMY
jgi:hypothetical protein